MEANLAAEAAGEISHGEGAPNDYFIGNENPQLRTFPLQTDVGLSVMGQGETGIGLIEVDPVSWAALLAEANRCAEANWPSDCADLGGDNWTWSEQGPFPTGSSSTMAPPSASRSSIFPDSASCSYQRQRSFSQEVDSRTRTGNMNGPKGRGLCHRWVLCCGYVGFDG